MLRILLRTSALTALGSALLAPPASAQIRLIPQVGLYQPFTKLPAAGAGFEEVKKQASFAFGAGIELGQPDKVSFRLNVLHATDSEVPVRDRIGVGCQTNCARSTVSTATATLILRPIPNIILVQPYLLGGGGVKRYDYTKQDLQDEGLRTLLNDQNQLTGHLGVGAEVNLGVARLIGEVSDLLSAYDDGQSTMGNTNHLQHDLFVTVGLVIGD
jgi:hypothetical protein